MSKLKYLIEYGLYLLIFLLPWQTRLIIRPGELGGGYSEYSTVSLYGTDILLAALLILFLVYKFRILNFKLQISNQIQNPKKIFSSTWFLIFGLLFFSALSIISAPDKELALYRFGVLFFGVGLFWLIASARYERTKLHLAFLAGVFIQAVLGIWQFFTQSTFASKWLGLARHDAGTLGTSVVETFGADGVGERWLRAYGALDHPNMLGGLLVIGILLVIFNLLRINEVRSKKLEARNSIFRFLTSYFLLLTSIAALFFTFSRSAWLGLAGGLGVMLLAAVIKKNYLAQKNFLKIILTGAILIFVLTFFYGHVAATRLSSGTRLEIKSNIERIASQREALGLIKEKPLAGHGLGNYTIAAHRADDGKNPSWFYQPVHNSYLLTASEIGIFGLFFLVVLIFSAVNNGWLKTLTNTRDNRAYLATGLSFALAVMLLFDHFWWSLHFGVLLFWFTLGIIFKHTYNQDHE